MRCDTSEREHISRGDGDAGGARAVAAQRGPSGFSEWRDSADLHHWQQGCRYLRFLRSPGKQVPAIGFHWKRERDTKYIKKLANMLPRTL